MAHSSTFRLLLSVSLRICLHLFPGHVLPLQYFWANSVHLHISRCIGDPKAIFTVSLTLSPSISVSVCHYAGEEWRKDGMSDGGTEGGVTEENQRLREEGRARGQGKEQNSVMLEWKVKGKNSEKERKKRKLMHTWMERERRRKWEKKRCYGQTFLIKVNYRFIKGWLGHPPSSWPKRKHWVSLPLQPLTPPKIPLSPLSPLTPSLSCCP